MKAKTRMVINGVYVPLDVPAVHTEMYAEWVKRGKPQMEFFYEGNHSWIAVTMPPKWVDGVQYRFKDSPLDEKSKAMRHLLGEMPIAKEFKAEHTEHDASPPSSALQTQVGGDHYRNCKLQPIEYIEANDLRFLEGSVVKRVTRHDKPTGKGKQDIEKAIHELQLLLELRYGDEG